MSKKKKEEVVEVGEETPQATIEQGEETPQVDESKFESVGDDNIIKVDLSKPPKTETDAVQESETNASDATVGESEDSKSSEKVVEEVRDTNEQSNKNALWFDTIIWDVSGLKWPFHIFCRWLLQFHQSFLTLLM